MRGSTWELRTRRVRRCERSVQGDYPFLLINHDWRILQASPFSTAQRIASEYILAVRESPSMAMRYDSRLGA